MDPRPTAPTPELERESPQEELARERSPEPPAAVDAVLEEVCRALADAGALRNDELLEAIGFEGPPEEWKARLWRLHNEGYVKVRWVGLADPDPVEVRITRRGRAWLEASRATASGPAPPQTGAGGPATASGAAPEPAPGGAAGA